MDLSKQPETKTMEFKKPLAWKCTSDGEHWKQSKDKKCRYCLPIYDEADLLDKAYKDKPKLEVVKDE